MKTRFWSSDWFAGLLITIIVVVLSGSGPFQSLERNFYDWGVRSTERFPSDKIAVIAIDDESINNIGRWPWPRDLHAELINRLTDGGAKVIGQTVFFLEPQIDPGTDHCYIDIRSLQIRRGQGHRALQECRNPMRSQSKWVSIQIN